MNLQSIDTRIKKFSARPDVQENLIEAVVKRLKWRLHWMVTDEPQVVSYAETLKINIPKSGSGSLIYYQGFSEIETATFVRSFLDLGMIFVDVGAHIGEYTLLAAKLVGETGEVHAFEPQPSLFPLLQDSIQINNFDHVKPNQLALCDHIGEVEFEVFDEPSVSSIKKQSSTKTAAEIIRVSTTSLDIYSTEIGRKIDLIKVDVEGAEKLVFEGATSLMSRSESEAPAWIFEYAPNAYAQFGYQTQDLLDLLYQHDYQVYRYSHETGELSDFSPDVPPLGIINLIAAKDKEALIDQLT